MASLRPHAKWCIPASQRLPMLQFHLLEVVEYMKYDFSYPTCFRAGSCGIIAFCPLLKCDQVSITNPERRINEGNRVSQRGHSSMDPSLVLVLVSVGVAIVVIVILLGLRARFLAHVAGDKLIELGESQG